MLAGPLALPSGLIRQDFLEEEDLGWATKKEYAEFKLVEGGESISHVSKSLEWESQGLQPQFTELKLREGRRLAPHHEAGRSRSEAETLPSLCSGLFPLLQAAYLTPGRREGIIWVSGGSPPGVFERSLRTAKDR